MRFNSKLNGKSFHQHFLAWLGHFNSIRLNTIVFCCLNLTLKKKNVVIHTQFSFSSGCAACTAISHYPVKATRDISKIQPFSATFAPELIAAGLALWKVFLFFLSSLSLCLVYEKTVGYIPTLEHAVCCGWYWMRWAFRIRSVTYTQTVGSVSVVLAKWLKRFMSILVLSMHLEVHERNSKCIISV